ncbi:MarR family transcriptional regulator [Dyella jejuensis]|uniref:MarR family transcriptional regulator n=1 Tax=Dyella jejuensis TaxID=1432009 RepID=A0ABW8JEW3_9GAMM
MNKHSPASAIPLATTVGDLRLVVGRLKRRMREEVGSGGLTWSQISVLGHLDREGPATVTALARAEGVRPQSMGATVAALEGAGMLAGEPHPTDRRQVLLSLTPAAREWIKASRTAREDWLLHVIQGRLSPAEQKQFARGVELLKRLVDAWQ